MKLRDLIRVLVEQHGAIVRTEHHVQIGAGARAYHDIWVGKKGLKAKLYGDREVLKLSPEALLKRLHAYNPVASDLADMQRLTRFLKKLEGKVGVFADAGWKGGRAVAAMVKMMDDADADILVRHFHCLTHTVAEWTAIRLAAERWPGETIHSDCQEAVRQFGAPAVWIPREQNREADMMGNARG